MDSIYLPMTIIGLLVLALGVAALGILAAIPHYLHAYQAINSIDNADDNVTTKGKPRLRSIAALLSRQCRAEFGFTGSSHANKMVARRFILTQIKQFKDLRKVDAARVVNMAVEFSMLMDYDELQLHQASKTWAWFSRIKPESRT